MTLKIDGRTRVYGVIANPVEHSMSPLLQNMYAERSGQNFQYVPFKVQKEDVEAAVRGAFALNVQGMNVTVPHKQAVMEYLTDIDETAAAIGAVNTLVRTETGYKGYNTDVPGLLRAMTEVGIRIKGRACIILGAGGAAKAAAYMLAKEGAEKIYLLNRSLERAIDLAAYVNGLFEKQIVYPLALSNYGKIPKGKYLAIQTTSVGMYPHTEAAPIEDAAFYEYIEDAVDAVYTPAKTRFMQLVENAGGYAVNGLSMLLYQGVISFELWNPGVTVADETILEARETINGILSENRARQEREREAKKQKDAGLENLILIGFMGAGKTSVGGFLAEQQGLPMVDVDRLIEISSGMSVSDIFEKKGEAEFRRRETQMLLRLLDTDTVVPQKTVISVGGGLPLREENRELLKKLGTVVFLKVSPESVAERLKGDTTRPLLQGEKARQKVAELMMQREPYYTQAAHFAVETDGKDLSQIACEIALLINGQRD